MKRLCAMLLLICIVFCACGRTAETLTTTAISPGAETCTLSIACTTLCGNSALPAEKAPFVPQDGYILRNVTMEILDGDTVFDILRRACAENTCDADCRFCRGGIALETSYTPGYSTYYVQGIHQLYEKDCGARSGWMFRVNGTFPNVGAGTYSVQNGDCIEWLYTCSMGEDL